VSLDCKVFLHSYLGLFSTSTLFYGERDAIPEAKVVSLPSVVRDIASTSCPDWFTPLPGNQARE
jgi:hypothetical protein